jgi:hypothetical protein
LIDQLQALTKTQTAAFLFSEAVSSADKIDSLKNFDFEVFIRDLPIQPLEKIRLAIALLQSNRPNLVSQGSLVFHSAPFDFTKLISTDIRTNNTTLLLHILAEHIITSNTPALKERLSTRELLSEFVQSLDTSCFKFWDEPGDSVTELVNTLYSNNIPSNVTVTIKRLRYGTAQPCGLCLLF